MPGKPPKRGRGVASAFLPAPPPRAAADVTATDPLRHRHAEDADDALIAHSDSAMAANDDLIPGGRYIDALDRQNNRAPRLATMDEHSVENIVNDMSRPPHNAMTGWNPADPYSADNPDVAKALRAQGLARQRKLK